MSSTDSGTGARNDECNTNTALEMTEEKNGATPTGGASSSYSSSSSSSSSSASALMPPPASVSGSSYSYSSSSSSSSSAVQQDGLSEDASSSSTKNTENVEEDEHSNLTGAELLKLGMALKSKKLYEQAIDVLGKATAKLVEQYGDHHLQVASAYGSYGDALLIHYEQSTNVLGDLLEGKVEEQTNGKPDGKPEDKPEVSAEEDNDNDLKQAFDLLELARVTYTAHYNGPAPPNLISVSESFQIPVSQKTNDPAVGLALAFIYERIAEAEEQSELWQQAYSDLERCLGLRLLLLPCHDRLIATTYSLLATCALFHGKLGEGVKQYKASSRVFYLRAVSEMHTYDNTKMTSLEASKLSEEELKKYCETLWASKEKLPEKHREEIAICKEIIDEIAERVVELQAQINEERETFESKLQLLNNLKPAIPSTTSSSSSSTSSSSSNPFSIFDRPSSNFNSAFPFASSNPSNDNIAILTTKRKADALRTGNLASESIFSSTYKTPEATVSIEAIPHDLNINEPPVKRKKC